MNFVNLFIETNYSMNGSNIKIKELVEKAIAYNYSSLAITDNKMYGVIKFYKECIKNDIKPIIGLNIIIEGINNESRNNILIYAKNNEGYQNLLKIASIQSLNKVITLTELKKYGSSIIGIVNTDNSEIRSYFNVNQTNEINEVFKLLTNLVDDIYFRLSENDDLNEFVSKSHKLVVLDYVHY
ncbi:MAG: PHP domain-containing protein, partial [Candidatus Izimaplasma sp.]|nr:PHP domain-containing protein [Candidatus Izimaplasma bacterium]